jgi:hypothetical protein
MNPYLENPDLWSEVHSRLIVNLADTLGLQLRPNYRVAVEKRTYLDASTTAAIGTPDVAIVSNPSQENKSSSNTVILNPSNPVIVRLLMPEEVTERYLEIREIATGKVITVIEILSPKNKRTGIGRDTYLKKRLEILASLTHLVEIDLLRRGQPIDSLDNLPSKDYRILVSRSEHRPLATLFNLTVQESIPTFSLPLQPNVQEPLIDLKQLLIELYEKGGFDLAIDYHSPPIPPLDKTNDLWLNNLLKEKKLR